MPLAVEPENHVLWDLWLALENHWRVVAGMSRMAYLGIDLQAANLVRKAHGIKRRDWPNVLTGLLEMERIAVVELNST